MLNSDKISHEMSNQAVVIKEKNINIPTRLSTQKYTWFLPGHSLPTLRLVLGSIKR